ncbi:uncharacterized protein BKA78DRAFT_2424 [Phyllosticta capitalensis]|uniref:uncharacterized protein n=1 Tax=Phyllosticta capitalensis TaxID=121624 RepID=UPI003131027D
MDDLGSTGHVSNMSNISNGINECKISAGQDVAVIGMPRKCVDTLSTRTEAATQRQSMGTVSNCCLVPAYSLSMLRQHQGPRRSNSYLRLVLVLHQQERAAPTPKPILFVANVKDNLDGTTQRISRDDYSKSCCVSPFAITKPKSPTTARLFLFNACSRRCQPQHAVIFECRYQAAIQKYRSNSQDYTMWSSLGA